MLNIHYKYRIMILFIILFLIAIPVAQADNTEKVQFDYGVRLYQEKLYDLAAIQFQSFVEKYQNSPDVEQAQYLLGESYFYTGLYDDAQKAYLDLLILYPRSSRVQQAYFRLGECLENQNRTDDAVEVYKQVFDRYPSSEKGIEAMFRASSLLMNEKKYQSAVEVTLTILTNSKEGELRSKSLILLGKLYEKQNRPDDAIKTYNQMFSASNPDRYKAEAYFHLGNLYEKIGYYGQSELYLRKTVASKQNELASQASLRLGHLMLLQNEYKKAVVDFQNSTRSDSISVKSEGSYWLGYAQLETGMYQDALTSANSAYQYSSEEVKKYNALLLKGLCLESMNRSSEASILYKILVDTEKNENSICQARKTALLRLARIAYQSESYAEAVAWYHNYLNLDINDLLSEFVLLQIGKIYLFNMTYIEEALQTFRRIWMEYPDSRIVPEARYYFAQCLTLTNRAEEARKNYRLIINMYPASIWADSAEVSIRKIDYEIPVIDSNVLSKLTEYLSTVFQTKKNTDNVLNLGVMAGESFKDWTRSIDLLKYYLRSNPDTSQFARAEYNIGWAYYNLYRRTNLPAYRDSAVIYFNGIHGQWVAEDLTDSAAFFSAELTAEESVQKGIQAFSALIKSNPSVEIAARANNSLSRLYLSVDSLHAAFQSCLELQKSPFANQYDEDVLFRMGQIALRLKNEVLADSLFEKYIEKYPKGKYSADIDLISGNNALKHNQTDQAIYWYEKIRDKYACSRMADSTAILIGTLYLKRGDYTNAKQLYEKLLKKDSLAVVAESVGLPSRQKFKKADILLGLAEADRGLKDYKAAKDKYFQLLKQFPDLHYRIAAHTGLAYIAQAEEEWDRAVDYLKRLSNDYPSDSTAFELGLCYYRLKQYDTAVSVFDKASQLCKDPELRAAISHRAILALLKQNKTSEADVRLNLFEKSFKKVSEYDEYMAEMILETGRSQQKKKNFKIALDLFKKVSGDYKKTSFAPEARLEIGRTYLITNKTDEALEILTDMPKQYPGNPVLAGVYLNLGDQYYRWQQFDNAIESFRKVINEFPDSEENALAMRYLIRVYDSVRMWDSALLLTRQYVERFPHADDILQKKVQIGIFYFDLKDFILAVNQFENILPESDAETEAEIQYWIGKSYYEMGQFEKAIYEFLKVKYIARPTKLPWATTALYEAGLAYIKLKKPDYAIKLFEKIIQTEGAASDLGRIAQQKINELEKTKELNEN